MSYNHNYLPKLIIEYISHDYGIEMSYHKAWRCRENVLTCVRGFAEMSYQKLLSYLYMLDKKNLGTVTHFETNKIGQFKYFFMALGYLFVGFNQRVIRSYVLMVASSNISVEGICSLLLH